MKKKKNKGITLIALVITIIVMLILVVVTINVATDGGLIAKAKKAADEMQRTADGEEQQIEMIALEADGIEKGYIVELADKYGNKYKYYRLDKVTKAQRENCREKGIPMLVGDGNLDGKVDAKDLEKILDIVKFMKVVDEYEKILFDLYIDGMIDSLDMLYVSDICNKLVSLRPLAIQKETGINIDKILVDEETGILYFIEEKVSEEEAKELEKYGVNKTMLGDLNLDGKLTEEDLDIMRRTTSGTLDLNGIQKVIGDFNGDEKVEEYDLIILAQKLERITTE